MFKYIIMQIPSKTTHSSVIFMHLLFLMLDISLFDLLWHALFLLILIHIAVLNKFQEITQFLNVTVVTGFCLRICKIFKGRTESMTVDKRPSAMQRSSRFLECMAKWSYSSPSWHLCVCNFLMYELILGFYMTDQCCLITV